MNTRAKGNAGEDAAAEYLLANGYTIETRNYQTKNGEIDIIANAPDGVLVFVEVKTSSGPAFGNPIFRITQAKKKSITHSVSETAGHVFYLLNTAVFGFDHAVSRLMTDGVQYSSSCA